jgi:hypothetical protein
MEIRRTKDRHKRQMTQEDIEKAVAGEKDLIPFSGAGSMRDWFERNDATPSAGKMRAERLEKEAQKNLEQGLNWFIERIRNGQPLQQEWKNAGFKDTCPLLLNLPLCDPGLAEKQEDMILSAMTAFCDSEVFAAYRERGSANAERQNLQKKIVWTLYEFLKLNHIDPRHETSWAAAWTYLNKAGMIPAAIPAPAAPVEPTLTPSQEASERFRKNVTEIIVYDPQTHIGYTENELSRLDSATERRLRRLIEGREFSPAVENFLETKDLQAKRDAEMLRQAMENN